MSFESQPSELERGPARPLSNLDDGHASPVRAAERPVAIIACKVLRSIILERLEAAGVPTASSARRLTFLEYGLHRFPQLMAPAIQEQIDTLPEPSLVVIGYGLCGNGVVGVKAREHTLLIPRTDDCIAMFLGSYETYLEEFGSSPGTYYLTKGWLESGSHPLSEYKEYREKYGPEDAEWLIDTQYQDYERLCFVAHSAADLETYRPQAMEVAQFGRERWGWRYEQRLGSDRFIQRLLDHALAIAPVPADDDVQRLGVDFQVVPPGGEIRQEDLLRGLS
jgi:hypothetical protein